MKRFTTLTAEEQARIAGLTTDELIAEIDALPEWDMDLIRDLCWRADLDITDDEEYPGPEECYRAALAALGLSEEAQV